jgi:mercuric reductase
MAKESYDVLILGRGAASFAAAIRLSELSQGKTQVAMVGTGPMGGTCVNVGCVPSKYFLEASHRYYYPQQKLFRGVGIAKPELNFGELMGGTVDLVSKLRNEKYDKVLNYYPNITVLEGKAKFEASNRIVVSNGDVEQLSAKNVLVAVGSRPSAPPIEGLSDTGYITSDTVWDMREKPGSIAVVGGGAIGLELGQAFSHLGVEVHVIEAMPSILPSAEPEVSNALMSRLEAEDVKFYIKARINGVEGGGRAGKVLNVVTAQGKTKLEVDEILVATGRRPNTDELGLGKAGVNTDKKGFVVVDPRMRTTGQSVYAAGDCISKRLMLETLAAREGVVAATNILGGEERVDYASTPWAVFTNPQVASVGMTEEEVMTKTNACSCRIVGLDKVAKAQILGEDDGLVKLVLDPHSGKVVGVHALSPNATEYIVEAALAIKHGSTYREIVETTHVFPTLSEALKLAAQAFVRNVDRMSCCVE